MRRSVLVVRLVALFVVVALGFGQRAFAQNVSVTATGVGPGPTLYATVNAAFTAINAGTHQGAITVNITGNTTEPATPVPLLASGAPSSYTSVLIRPTGNVTVNAAAAPTAGRAILEFHGADNVTIDGDDAGTSGTRNLTISQVTVASSLLACVRFASQAAANGATFNTIRNCIVIGSRFSAVNTQANFGIYSGTPGVVAMTAGGQSDNNDNLTIENNEVRRCYTGIYVAGTAANRNDNLIIRSNVVGSSTAADATALRGINIQNTQATAGPASAIVELNDVQMLASTSATTDMAAIEVQNGNAGALVRRNTVHDVQHPNTSGFGSFGILVSGSGNNAGVEISNNFIRDVTNANWSNAQPPSGDDLAAGIYVTVGATGLKIYHNSISMNTANLTPATAGWSACLALNSAGATGSDIRNNIFSNTQTGVAASTHFCVWTITGFVFGTINGNNYRVPADAVHYVGYAGGATRLALANWQAITAQDAASKAVNPAFTSTTNLHIPAATVSQLESAGVAGTGITSDIDATAQRPGPPGSVNGGGTANDIGADEFDGTPLDATPPSISYTALGTTCSLGARTLSATITDASGVPTAGAGRPVLYWRINAGAYTAATGTFISGSQYDFSFGAGVVSGDVVSYYMAAQDNAGTPNVTTNPSAGASGFTANPPAASTPPTTPNSYAIQNTLAAGTYLVGVGQVAPNYATIAAAVAAYNSSCLGGAIVFQLVDASYAEGPLTINANADASATNTLTIRPAAGNSPTISASSTTAIFILNGADHVTINGSNAPVTNSCCPLVQSSRNMTISNTSTSTTSAVVWMSSGSTNNAVRNCIVAGNASTTTLVGVGMGGASIGITSLGTANNTNAVENNVIRACQHGVYTQGASGASKNTGNSITLNTMNIIAPNNIGIIGVLTGFENNLTISCNSIGEMNGSSDRAAISAGFGTSFSTSTLVGNEVTHATITSNIIGNVIGSNFNTYLGIALCSAASGTSTISNNMVSGVIGPATSPDYTAGIIAGGGAGSTTHVLHNTVHMQGTMVTGGGAFSMVSACLAMPNTAFGTMNVRNNIFSNVQQGNAGATGRFTAIATAASTFTGFTSSNNDLYAAGAGPGTYHVGITGGLTGTSRTSLTDWQTATGQDAGSVNVLPVFLSSTDLHLDASNASNISNLMTGGTNTSVTTDIDCATRNGSTPSIGADEISLPACSGMPSAGTSAPATISVCAGTTVVMSNDAVNAFGGIGYQWQVGPTGGPYTNVVGGTGATTQNYTTGALAQGTYYYILRVRCGNEIVPAGDSYSNEVEVIVGAAPPVATASVVLDCDAPGFYIAVNLTSLGGAFDVNLVPSTGSPLNEVAATGVYNLGPFTSGSSVSVNVVNNSDPFCSLNLGSFSGTLNCINNGDCLASGVQNIPDNGCGTNTTLDVHFPISGMQDDLNANVILSSVDVQIEHTWRGDIMIRLISPSGQSRDLFLQKPSSSALGFNLGDLTQPCPDVPLTFQDGGALLTTLDSDNDDAAFGIFAPEQTLAGFTGNPNGTWTLRMCDAAAADVGSLRHVKLNFLNMDCLGVFGGTTLPGSLCNDGNVLTTNDAYDANCLCSGEFVDCLAVPNGTALPGTACDDGFATTGNDIYQPDCSCAGELIDCEGVPGGSDLPGSPCDDNNAGTNNDLWDGSCNCAGTPFGCQDNEVSLDLGTNGAGAETSWEIIPSGGGAALCSGSGYPNNTTTTETCCLANGCYQLLVYDSFNDGMAPGGYRLLDENGARIIDNWQDGAFAGTSAIANNGDFCLPLGTVAMQASSCDQLALTPTSVVSAVPDAGVTAQYGVGVNTDDGYQFWIYDPDGTYSRTIFKSHTNPGQPGQPFGPTAAAYLKLSSIVTMPVPTNVKLNIKVRSRVNGTNSRYGPACTMMIDVINQCPTTQLVNNTNSSQHSCGATGKVVGASGNTGKIFCTTVPGANKYQWRFVNSTNSYVRTIGSATAVLPLNNWATNPLLCGTHTYDVSVRISFDNGGTYCPYGAVCTVGITNNNATPLCTPPTGPFAGGLHMGEQEEAGMRLWPNPVREGNVTLEFTGVASDVTEMHIVVMDLFGKTVVDQHLRTDGAEQVKTTLTLGTDIASGLYVVNVTAGTSTFTERLVVE